MAVQMHVSYSQIISGVAAFAGVNISTILDGLLVSLIYLSATFTGPVLLRARNHLICRDQMYGGHTWRP